MKKNRFQIFLLLACIFAFSCRRDLLQPSTSLIQNTAEVAEARAFFDAQHNTQGISPDWSRADTLTDSKWHIVDVPVYETIPIGALNSQIVNGKKINLNNMPNGQCRLIVAKNKITGQQEASLMRLTAYNESGAANLHSNTYRTKTPSFTGSVLFITLDDRFVNGWEFTAGKPTDSLKIIDLPFDSTAQLHISEHVDKSIKPQEENGTGDWRQNC